MEKQTAVDWLHSLHKKGILIEKSFEMAKEIEKEQMIDFLDSVIDYTKESHNILGVSDDREAKDYFEQYYSETYGPQVDKK